MTGMLQDYLCEQAERRGDGVALVLDDQTMTYAELEASSNQLARRLVDVGCGSGDRVCLMADKSPAAIAAMLATLKAGCAYVPIDVAGPASRVSRVVRSADPAAILVSDSGIELWRTLHETAVLAPELPVGALSRSVTDALEVSQGFDAADLGAESTEPLASSERPDDVAQILYTSGSTGEPKGVMITHANVRAFIDWAVTYFGIGPGDKVSGHPPLHFDLSTFDIYGSLCAGAELNLVPTAQILPRQLAEFITRHDLIQWFSVPSAMTYMARFGGLPDTGFPSLERVLWCGEVLPAPVLAQWMQLIPRARFTNLYGPTETTIASSHHTVTEIPATASPIPIGIPCAGEELFIIRDDGEPAADGELGEIYIGGTGVTAGYWRDEDTTGAAFVPDPRPGAGLTRVYRTGDLARIDEHGRFNYAGRCDMQIKSRGYRIELGEIETTIGALVQVAECAVVPIPEASFAGTAICCAFVARERAGTPLRRLRASVRELLPTYMLPTHWRQLDALPKNQNGKIDRPALADLFISRNSSPDA